VDVPPTLLDILLQTFADLRETSANAQSDEQKLESSLSTAEQIGVLEDALLHGRFFGDKGISPSVMARSLVGTLVRRVPEDVSILNKFWHGTVEPATKKRKDPEWDSFLEGGKEALSNLGGK
jgi:hypothetical protein